MLYLNEDAVLQLLNWEELVPVIKEALIEVSQDSNHVMPPRSILNMPQIPGSFITMPAYSSQQSLITCKLVTLFPENEKRFSEPSITGIVVAFDTQKGKHVATLEAENLTEWRTAAGSIVATLHLHCADRRKYSEKTLAVLGAGRQGRIHIIGFQKFFRFGKIRLWNRTTEKANILGEDLRTKENIDLQVFETVPECVKNADVVIAAFSETEQHYLTLKDLKPDAYVNVVGTSFTKYPSGISEDVYHSAQLFTESQTNIVTELSGIVAKEELDFEVIGKVISKEHKLNESKKIILYQSLGVALMDNAAVKFLLEKYKNKNI